MALKPFIDKHYQTNFIKSSSTCGCSSGKVSPTLVHNGTSFASPKPGDKIAAVNAKTKFRDIKKRDAVEIERLRMALRKN
jgi:hypothetical protein